MTETTEGGGERDRQRVGERRGGNDPQSACLMFYHANRSLIIFCASKQSLRGGGADGAL